MGICQENSTHEKLEKGRKMIIRIKKSILGRGGKLQKGWSSGKKKTENHKKMSENHNNWKANPNIKREWATS